MAQLFHPSTNVVSKLSVVLVAMGVGGSLFAWDQFLRSPYVTDVGIPQNQPVPFSHKHHVEALGIDCRYCHHSVEESAFAGVPSSKVCMTCHSQVWNEAWMLDPVRESFRSDTPLEWTRVHDLPDYVYFDHSVHIAKGVGCSSCHGRVDQMPLMMRSEDLSMGWCLDCHRDPEIREQEDVFNMDWTPGDLSTERREELIDEHHVNSLQNCSICHR